MSEQRCTLGTGLYWEGRGEVPDFCKEKCGPLWEDAIRSPADSIDVFSEACMKACGIEYGDEALQRTDEGPGRSFSILNMCMRHNQEMFAEEYSFLCSND